MKTLIILLMLSTTAVAADRTHKENIPASRDYSKPYQYPGGASPQSKLFKWDVVKNHAKGDKRREAGRTAVNAATIAGVVVWFILAM